MRLDGLTLFRRGCPLCASSTGLGCGLCWLDGNALLFKAVYYLMLPSLQLQLVNVPPLERGLLGLGVEPLGDAGAHLVYDGL